MNFHPKSEVGTSGQNETGSERLISAHWACSEAITAAPCIMPKTGAVFCSASARYSYHTYASVSPVSSKADHFAFRDPITLALLIDLRMDAAIEGIQLEDGYDGIPARVDISKLSRLVGLTAAAAVLARYYPEEPFKASAANRGIAALLAKCRIIRVASAAKSVAEAVLPGGEFKDLRRALDREIISAFKKRDQIANGAAAESLHKVYDESIVKSVHFWLGVEYASEDEEGPSLEVEEKFDADAEDETVGYFFNIAKTLAERGLHVFPLIKNSKNPAVNGFPTRATADLNQVRKWDRNGPNRNVGVSTTLSKFGPLVVIDVDNKNGVNGDESLDTLRKAEGVEIPETLVVATPTGGRHIYFVAPHPIKQGVSVLGPGLDIRAAGGYVVGPGSMIDGVAYRIIEDRDIAPAPQWLIERLPRATEKSTKKERTRPREKTTRADNANMQERALDWLQRYAPQGTAGSRNDTAFVVAARLKDFDLDEAAILELMVEHWDCVPPAPVEDLERIIGNAFQYGRDEPGCADPKNVFEAYTPGAGEEPTGEASDGGNRTVGGDRDEEASAEGARAWEEAQARQKKEQGEARLKGYFFDGDTPPAPPKQLIKRLLNSTGVAVIGGQSGAGKTFVVVDMAAALASGQAFFSHKVKERVGVAIVAYEGAGSIHLRINAAREARGIDGTLPIIWTRGDADLRSKDALTNLAEDLKALAAEMQKRFGVRLGCIVIDTLGRAFSMKDENDNAEANAIIGALDRLSIGTGAVVVAVHHYGKTEAVGLRGASAWRGGADTVLSVLADRNETTGAVSNRRLALAKSRDDEEGPISGFELVEVRVGVDEDLETITTCHVRPREARPAQSEIEVPLDKAQECLAALRGQDHRYDKQAPAWAGRIIARVLSIDLGADGAKKKIEKIIDRWVAEGVLESFTAPDASRKDKIYVRVIGEFEP